MKKLPKKAPQPLTAARIADKLITEIEPELRTIGRSIKDTVIVVCMPEVAYADAQVTRVSVDKDDDGAVILLHLMDPPPPPEEKFASTCWMVGDVTCRTKISKKAAAEFLRRNGSHIVDLMVERGNEVIDQMLLAEGYKLGDD